MAATRIGRFNILRELGKGTQGAVHLAYDPQLDRQVAIKTLRPGAAHTETLLHEAHIVINKKTVGLFYADMQQANTLKLSEQQLSLLRTLRNQAVLAIKQKM